MAPLLGALGVFPAMTFRIIDFSLSRGPQPPRRRAAATRQNTKTPCNPRPRHARHSRRRPPVLFLAVCDTPASRKGPRVASFFVKGAYVILHSTTASSSGNSRREYQIALVYVPRLPYSPRASLPTRRPVAASAVRCAASCCAVLCCAALLCVPAVARSLLLPRAASESPPPKARRRRSIACHREVRCVLMCAAESTRPCRWNAPVVRRWVES
jgi:hypothetical protein